MVQINLQIKGLERVENLFRNLPGELQKEINLSSKQFLKDVRKSAKLRAPRYTGFLASSIFVDANGKNRYVLTVEAPYAYEQETGKGLPREVPISELKMSGWTREASRTRGRLIKGGGGTASKGKFMKRSYKPFIQPALEHNIARFQTILSDSTKRAIRQSRR
jgi:hypothetical protein